MTVVDADTAVAWGSGDVPVLSTPRVVALCEQACVLAISGALTEDETSVGAGVQISHVAPSPVGAVVRVEVTLERIEGRRLRFSASVSDDHGLVAAGKLTRAVVNRERFLDKISHND